MSRQRETLHVWRFETETSQQLLTSGFDEQFPQVSVDGKRVYYVSWESGAGTVWRVSINGGQPSQVISESSYYPELSPDGKLLTYVSFENRKRLRKVVSRRDTFFTERLLDYGPHTGHEPATHYCIWIIGMGRGMSGANHFWEERRNN